MHNNSINLDSIINDFLSFEKPLPEIKKNVSFLKRREIDKQVQDDINADNDRVLREGEQAEAFLNSSSYKKLTYPFIHNTIKNGLQKLLTKSDSMSDVEIRTTLAMVNCALRQIGTYKLKILQAQVLKEKL